MNIERETDGDPGSFHCAGMIFAALENSLKVIEVRRTFPRAVENSSIELFENVLQLVKNTRYRPPFSSLFFFSFFIHPTDVYRINAAKKMSNLIGAREIRPDSIY